MSAAYLALAFMVGGLVMILVSPKGRHGIQSARPYDFRAQVEARKPDLVLVGNSIVHINIDREALERLLTEKLGRRIRVIFASDGATGLGWWYLAIKNQVMGGAHKDFAIGLVVSGTNLSSFESNPSPRDLWRYSKLIDSDDPTFFAKIGEKHKAKTDIYRRMPDRRLIGRFLLRKWTNAWLFWMPGHSDGQALVSARLRLAEPHPFAVFQSNSRQEMPTTTAACLDLSACADRTLLPDLIKASAPARLFVVDSHRRPGLPDEASEEYRVELRRFLAARRVPVLTLRTRSELDAEGLWADDNHVNAAGVAVNTRLLAEEIVAHNLLPGRITASALK